MFMAKRKLWIIAGSIALVGAIGGGAALASGAFDEDPPLTGSDYDRATQAALEHTGGGTVIETEAGDDGAAYGVEVRLDDGSVVEVNLDENFNVIGSEADDDGAGDREAPNDD
jgi:hypothetical protein